MHASWRRWAAPGLAAVALGGALALSLGIPDGSARRRPDPPPRPQPAPAPRAPNGFTLLSLGDDDVYWPRREPTRRTCFAMALGDAFDPALAQEVRECNATVLRQLAASLATPDFVCPTLEAPNDGLSTGWNTLGRVVAVGAFEHAAADRVDEAFDAAMQLVRLAHHIQSTAGASLMHWTVASMLKQTGLACLHTLALRHLPSDDLVAALVRELDERRADRATLERALAVDARFERQLILSLAAGEQQLDDLWFFDDAPVADDWRTTSYRPAATIELSSRARGLLVAALGRPYDPDGLRTVLDALIASAADLRAENDIGVRFVRGSTLEGLPLILKYPCAEDVAVDAVRTVLALRWHTHRTGRQPMTLSALHSAWFPATPVDPYDGQALRYAPERGVVYSVGEDRVDAGGSDAGTARRARQDLAEPTYWVRDA
ncbi:MAG: hypothetical protein AAF628_29745 [Planctomycetota bacterium]